MRTIVTELWNQTAAVQGEADANAASIGTTREEVSEWAATTNARLNALEQATGTRSAAGVYRLDVAPGGDPGNGEVCTSTGALDSQAQWLRFAALSRGG